MTLPLPVGFFSATNQLINIFQLTTFNPSPNFSSLLFLIILFFYILIEHCPAEVNTESRVRSLPFCSGSIFMVCFSFEVKGLSKYYINDNTYSDESVLPFNVSEVSLNCLYLYTENDLYLWSSIIGNSSLYNL